MIDAHETRSSPSTDDADDMAGAMSSAAMSQTQDEAEAENAERDQLTNALAALQAANVDAKPSVLPPQPIVFAARINVATFSGELRDAGIIGLSISWSAEGVILDPSLTLTDQKRVMAVIEAHDPDIQKAVIPPDCNSLPFWRMGLKIWARDAGKGDGSTIARFGDVDSSIKRLENASTIATRRLGMLAREQFEYASSVSRADLLAISTAFGFSPADVDESLWRADQVRQGDLSGLWPVPAK